MSRKTSKEQGRTHARELVEGFQEEGTWIDEWAPHFADPTERTTAAHQDARTVGPADLGAYVEGYEEELGRCLEEDGERKRRNRAIRAAGGNEGHVLWNSTPIPWD